MKLCILTLVLAAVVYVECGHTFFGTNFMRPLVYHRDVKYSSKYVQKRIEYLNYTLPYSPYGSSIQGILLYDRTNSGASANVTRGGIGFNFVNIRMKSDRAMPIQFDVYIYA